MSKAAPKRGRTSPRPNAPALEVRIDALAPGGAGLARGPRGAIFVERVAPGDLVRIAPVSRDRADLVTVVEPGPERVAPPCPFASRCGGCDWMHLSKRAQIDAHRELVASMLGHALGYAVDVRALEPPAWERSRTRARLFAETRGNRAEIGYRAARSHELAVVDDCLVLDDALFRAARDAIAWTKGGKGTGDVSVAWGLRASDDARGPVVDLAWRGELPASFWARADEACGPIGAFAGVRVTLDGARAATTLGDPRPLQTGVDGLPVRLKAGGFAQASDAGAALLAREVVALAAPEGRDVLELYSGSGTLSVALARGASRFTSLEVDADAVVAARENFVRRGLAGKLGVGDADTAAISPAHDVVVLDPPRRGAPGAMAAITKARTKVVVYVSCDPASLARDAKVLAAVGYTLDSAATLGLFPFTSHVETVARFVKRPPRSAKAAS
jgi:23S rRNA (uracil1939-C5)-methyltransferase